MSFKVNKVTLKDLYVTIPNYAVEDIIKSDPNAFLMLMTILSNKTEFFKKKEDLFDRIGWAKSTSSKWIKAKNALIELGYMKETGDGNFEASNCPIYKNQKEENKKMSMPEIKELKQVEQIKINFNKEAGILKDIPFQREDSQFTKEEWILMHTPKTK